MRSRLGWGLVAGVALWVAFTGVASASSHCSGVFNLERHACEVAHHGPFVAMFGGLTGVIALVASGLTGSDAGTRSPLPRRPRGRRPDDEEDSLPNTLNTQDPRETADVDPGPDLRDPQETDADAGRPRVEPLDPGLPDLEPLEVPVMSQEVADRWAVLGADGEGRIVDRHGQHVLTIERNGTIRDLAGNPIQQIPGDDVIVDFTDAQGRVIEYNAAGEPVQRIAMPDGGTHWEPVTDLPSSAELRPDLADGVKARWTGAGAGPEGQLYGADGRVIGRINTEGEMRTLDGRLITGHATPEGGRIPEFTVEGGERVRTAPAPPPGVEAPRTGDEDLAALVRRTAEGQARQEAPTVVRPGGDTAPPAGGEGDARTPPDGAGETPRAPEGEAPRAPSDAPEAPRTPDGGDAPDTPRTRDADGPRAPEGEAPRAPADTPEAPRTPDGGDTPRTTDADGPRAATEPDGPRGAGLLSGAMDLQGAIEQVNREMAEGRSAGEAVTRAVAMTHVGNAIGDKVTTNLVGGQGLDFGRVTDVRVTLLGSAMLPEGMSSLLPDQMAANTMGTGIDALRALAGDAASSLGGGEVDTGELDKFARALADRRGADPWAGYARVGEFLGEELGDADMNPFRAVSNVVGDLRSLSTEDVTGALDESSAEFGREALEGRHGAVLQGYSEMANVIGDPGDPVQLGRDLLTMARVTAEDALGQGDTEGFGADFWQQQADHANATMRRVPVFGTAFDGYAQVASGIEEQGVGGFSAEMAEGAAALASEGATAASNAAASTYNYLRSWF